MMPTLNNSDNLWVEKISPKLQSFHYGEIVTVDVPLEVRKIYDKEKNPIIKRVIALEGDSLEVKDGKVYINGVVKEEPYIKGNITEVTGLPEYSKLKVPAGKIFVMGDNRGNSTDSRIIGPVNKKWIVGRAIFRFWPLKHFGFIK
jgi:signal peptidase I